MGNNFQAMIRFVDYAVSYLTLKIARTLLISVVLMLFILFLRRILTRQRGMASSGSRLYIRLCLWVILIPVPFLGALRLSMEYFRWRNYIYVFLYETIMGNPVLGRLYFGGMMATALWFLVRNARIKRKIRAFPLWQNRWLDGKEEKALNKIQIRLSPYSVTPFTVGVIRPVIVLPETMIETFDELEIRQILRHEMNHIRKGHLIFYRLIDIYRVLWFLNPLAHLCARWIKDDLELICDYDTIDCGQIVPEEYGLLLIKSVECLGADRREQPIKGVMPALAAKRSFRVMKKRIQMISGYKSCSGKLRRGIFAMAAVFVLLLFVAGNYLSYPAYTPFDDYSLYNAKGTQVVIQNSPELNAAVKETEDGLLIQNDKVKELLKNVDGNDNKEFYWIYYGGFMKMPGIGGGGEVIEYDPYETEDSMVRLSSGKKNWFAIVQDWFYKYM